MNPFSEQRIAALDQSGQLADILALPGHFRDAYFRAETAKLQLQDSPGGLIVAGMGGSAIGGSLAVAVFGGRAIRPISVSRNYALPPWVTPNSTVLCASYSGNTEETLAAYAAAGVIGAQRVVLTTGGKLAAVAQADGVPIIGLPTGMQPRAAVAYMLVGALGVAAACGCGPDLQAELDAVSVHLDRLVAQWGPGSTGNSLAKQLAHGFYRKTPVIIGAELTVPVAYRWKTQLHENSKVPAIYNELPELDHNEIIAFENTDYAKNCAVVFLEDVDTHPRIQERVNLTERIIKEAVASTQRVTSLGETSVERLTSLILLGDLTSFYLAILNRIDPAAIKSIDQLKAALG